MNKLSLKKKRKRARNECFANTFMNTSYILVQKYWKETVQWMNGHEVLANRVVVKTTYYKGL